MKFDPIKLYNKYGDKKLRVKIITDDAFVGMKPANHDEMVAKLQKITQEVLRNV